MVDTFSVQELRGDLTLDLYYDRILVMMSPKLYY